MKTPLVSIILATYNWSKYIKESIESVLSQSYNNFEFIIINDCSTDNVEKIILSYKDNRIIYIKNKENLKLTKSLNKWLKIAKWKYIARIDDDDIWCDINKLKKQVSFMEKNPDYWLCWTWSIFIDENWKELTRELKRWWDSNIRNHILQWNHFSHPTIIMRKNILNKIWNYCKDKKCLYIEDYDLWLKIWTVSKFDNLQEYSIKYRVRSWSITRKHRLKQKINTFLIYFKYFKFYPSKIKWLCAQLIILLFPNNLIKLIVKINKILER